ACQPRDHAALYSCQCESSQRGLSARPSACLTMATTEFHGTTIISVRHAGHVVVAGDGQVTMGTATIMKTTAKKVRRLHNNHVLAGFAGAVADSVALFDKFEGKLQEYNGVLRRAAVELAKDWRTDRILRRLEALLVVADRESSLMISGT